MNASMDRKTAIVALGALFPDARDVDEFWQNIITKKVSIRPLPEDMFESEVFYRPDLLTAIDKKDKSITKIGAWIQDLSFDTVRKYKIPPSVAEHMDPNQHAALYTVDQALGVNPLVDVPRDRVAIVMANGMVGTQYGKALARIQFQLVEHYLKKHAAFDKLSAQDQDDIIGYVSANVLRGSIPITEDSAPGILPNLIAGRIANVYDFHGPSFTVDAACASALAAVIVGLQKLQLEEYDAVICGGADMPLKQLGFVYFSALNALSPDGSFPFDKRANGFVMGQGAGTVILKRLGDAVRDGDRIYAVITGYGESSDGKGKYIAAPNAEWQARTIEKACRMASYPVDTIELIEAHGTATKVGDVVEVAALKQAFRNLGNTRRNYCGLTSVKSNIGHLKSAAGIPGLMKAVLALHHKALPPTASFEVINPKLALEDSPFYVLDQLREWEPKREHPRRANVSAFGFGGANYHVALEEYREEDYARSVYTGFTPATARVTPTESAIRPRPSTADEVVFFSGKTRTDLYAQAEHFISGATTDEDVSFADRCSLHNYSVSANKRVRLAVLASSLDEVASKVHASLEGNDNRPVQDLLRTKGIFYKQGDAITPARTAILFPGQASQYLGMFRSVYDEYDLTRAWYHRADAYWLRRHGHTVRSLVFPSGVGEEEALDRLRETQNAHPCIFVASFALFDLLRTAGLTADYMIGHSLGEITALAAAGRLSFDDALELVDKRGYAFHDADLPDPGKMIGLKGSLEQAEESIQASGIDVSIANINGPQQIIVAGRSPNVDQFKAFLDERQVKNKLLFVSHAFHTRLLDPVAERFYQGIQDIVFRTSNVQVTMNHTGAYYPDGPDGVHQMPHLLRDQILQPVNFVRSVSRLHQDGVQLFVEVGPNAILSNLVKDILGEKDVVVLPSNYKSADDLTSLKKLYGALFAEGVPLKLTPARQLSRPMEAEKALQPVIETSPQATEQYQERDLTQERHAPRSRPAGGRETVVYSGVAVGLPGSYKQAFRDDNFEQLFEGRNLIERLTDEERQRLVDLQISKLVKDERGPSFKLLSSLNEVIQLAGKAGKLDVIRDYRIDESEARNMTSCIAMGVAAGYEALRDAEIPLVQEYVETSTGRMLPGKLTLPAHMQEETGVIFANGFPMIDPVIEEVSRYISYYYGSKTRKEMMAFYESIIGRLEDETARKLLTDWYVLYYSRLSDNMGQEDVYRFNYNFMKRISAQANNRLATLINAKGPNFQMNAACSSTSNAITIAEDFIQSGRVKRMIIVGADDATSKGNLPLLGAGFLSTGAATNEGDLYRAALPFDRRRNGMIMSAGAVGLVLETKTEIDKRGVIEVCELLGTHSFNTATHPSQIDANQFANELDKFVGRMEQEHGLQRDQVARDAIYISHETYTPPRGGCSQTEAEALRRAFGEDYRSIIVGNTKGMTGHAMGASFEDAVAAKSLQYGRIPPVVNCSEPDPMLEGLNLSRGGFHDRSFALKMSAGFGSQGHFALLKKSASGDHRIRDAARHRAWVKGVASNEHPTTDYVGRLYVVKENGAALKRPVGTPASQEQSTMLTAEPRTPKLTAPRTVEVSKDKLSDRVVELISELTAYPPEMLEPDMEFEADLGIGQDIRADIVTALTELHALPEKAIQLSGDSTIGDLVERVLVLAGTDATNEAAIPRTAAAASASEPPFDKESIRTETLRVFSEVTKYPRDMLELEMEMEADLGIDTVKQATILSILGETYQLERDEDLQLSDYPTIGHIVDLVYERAGGHAQPGSTGTTGVYAIEIESALDVKEAIEAETLRVFAEVTKYPEDMLELDMEMEADLGIDTVKQATILSILGETYQLERDEDLQLSDYPTIGHIVDLVYERGRGVEKRPTETREAEEVITSYQPEPLPALDRTTLSRQVTVLNEVDLGPKDFDLQDKTVWILGDDKAPVSKLATACQQKNAHVVSFVFPRSTSAQDVEAAAKDLASNTAADAIIDCTHIGHLVHFDQLSADEARELLFMSSEARFALYKHLSSSMKHPTKILCLTAMDGCVGAGSSDRPFTDPTYGALSGFYKGLRKEWLDSDVRIIDFAPQAIEDQLETCIGQVLAEIEHSGTGVEIAYPDARRAIVCIEDEETQAVRELSLGEGDTLLSIGGGTGIASGILLALAERYPISFNIVGTVPLPEDVASLAQLDDEGLGQLKQDLRESLERKHAKLKPVMLKRAYERITKAIQVYRNIERMKSFGRQVVYTACDVRDYEKLEQSLNRARETFGPITAVLYAAGIDRSHLLDQKDVQEFHDVFTIKAQGVYNLMHLCQDDPLKLIVAMSSIAGRFGNAGQLDYCAANSFLSDWVKMMCHSRPGLHAISLVWSGWRDLGIAWRNELVRERSEELGLNLIEVDQGVAACLLEIEHVSEDREVILHRGLDGFLERGLAAVHLPDYPLVDRLTKKDGRIDRTYRVFSVKRDALIDQHRLGPVPILPAVAYSELAAEYYALQAGPADQYVLRDVSFANAFKLFHDEARELFVEGRPVNGGQAWEINVRSIFRPPMGQEAQIVHHSQSTVSSQLDDHHDMHPQNWTYDQAEPIVLPVETSLQLLQGSGPGQRIILGPLYNDVLRESRLREPVLVYPRGVTYPTYFPQEQLTNDKYPLEHLLINPCFLDSIYQACAASLLVNKERVYLPWEVKELGIVRVPRQEGLYTTYAQVVESHDDIVGFDVAMVDGDGRTCYYARNARFRMINL